MANLIKNIALAAGTGIAVGLCATASSRRASLLRERSGHGRQPAIHPVSREDDLLRIEPVLDRLERLESCLGAAETTGETSALSLTQELTRRLEEQEIELRALRARFAESEHRAALASQAVDGRFGELEATLETRVETKVSERIGALEKTLAVQSASLGELGERSVQTDANLQRLVESIDRLCERTAPPPPAVLPFEAALAEATQRGPADEPFIRLFKEKEPEVKKARFPLARIFAFVLALGLPRFMR